MLNKLTIIIPTRNREKSINVQADYIKDWGSEIFVIDGSDNSNPYLNNLSKEYSHITYVHDTKGFFERFEHVKNKIKTKYSMLMPDDEFFVKKSLEMCINFLENNDEYASCSGTAIGFMKSLENKVIYKEMYPRLVGYEISSDNPKNRVIDHMSKYVPCSVYGVVQSRVLNKFIKELEYSKTSYTETIESWHQCTTAYMGKIMVLPVLYWFRNLHVVPVQDVNWNRSLKFYKWFNGKKFKEEREKYIKNFCMLNNENSTNFFKLALSNFSKDLNKKKGQGTIKLATKLFVKRSINLFLRKFRLYKILARKNESTFFNFEVLQTFLSQRKIIYDIKSIKEIEQNFLKQ